MHGNIAFHPPRPKPRSFDTKYLAAILFALMPLAVAILVTTLRTDGSPTWQAWTETWSEAGLAQGP